jgi:hypothetical protein
MYMLRAKLNQEIGLILVVSLFILYLNEPKRRGFQQARNIRESEFKTAVPFVFHESFGDAARCGSLP